MVNTRGKWFFNFLQLRFDRFVAAFLMDFISCARFSPAGLALICSHFCSQLSHRFIHSFSAPFLMRGMLPFFFAHSFSITPEKPLNISRTTRLTKVALCDLRKSYYLSPAVKSYGATYLSRAQGAVRENASPFLGNARWKVGFLWGGVSEHRPMK